MKNSFLKLLKSYKSKDSLALQEFADREGFDLSTEEGRTEAANGFAGAVDFVSDILKGKVVPTFSPRGNEASYADDLSILFKKAVEQRLATYKPVDTFLLNNATEVMEFSEDTRMIEFVSFGPMEAGRMGSGDNYQVTNPSVTTDNVEMKIERYGAMAEYPIDMLSDTAWPLLALTTNRMTDAILRARETQLFDIVKDQSYTVLDNTVATASFHTNGKDESDAKNFTFSMKDLTKMMGYMVSQRYNGTHLLSHPLMWGVFANDPYLRATFFHGGSVGGSIHTTAPQFNQQINIPGGIVTYVPYANFGYSDESVLAANPDASGLDSDLVADIYLIDAANALFHAKAGEPELANHEEFSNDMFQMKVRARFASAPKDGGRGMAKAKGVRNDYNYEALFTVRQV